MGTWQVKIKLQSLTPGNVMQERPLLHAIHNFGQTSPPPPPSRPSTPRQVFGIVVSVPSSKLHLKLRRLNKELSRLITRGSAADGQSRWSGTDGTPRLIHGLTILYTRRSMVSGQSSVMYHGRRPINRKEKCRATMRQHYEPIISDNSDTTPLVTWPVSLIIRLNILLTN